jgi:catalase
MRTGALWQKVMDDSAKRRLVETVAGHISTCKSIEVIRRQIGIFREVSADLGEKLEAATGVKGYPGVSGMSFSGSYNGFPKDDVANGLPTANGGARGSGIPNGGHMEAEKALGAEKPSRGWTSRFRQGGSSRSGYELA